MIRDVNFHRSYGVLLWEVMSLGFLPYPGRGNQEIIRFVNEGGRLESPTSCPPPIYRIMRHCWQRNADDRPVFATILERLGYCLQVRDHSVLVLVLVLGLYDDPCESVIFLSFSLLV